MLTSTLLRWPYSVTVPSEWRSLTQMPYPAVGPASMTTPSEAATIGVPIELAMSMPPCSTPQRYPKPDVHTPRVGITNIGRARRASRSARSCANAEALVISSACTAELDAGATVTTCMPSTEPVMTAPPVAVWSAASTVSAGGRSAALEIEYAPAAVAPTAIAATISRPLTGTPSSLRCRPRRLPMSMMSVAAMPSLTSVWLSR